MAIPPPPHESTKAEPLDGNSKSLQGSRSSSSLVTLIAYSIAFAAVCLAPFAYRNASAYFLDPDPFTYGQYAREVLSGKNLYRDTVYDKGPLMYLVYAIPESLVPRSYPALGAFLGIYLAIQAIAFFWIFRANPPAALAAALVMTVIPLTNYSWQWLSTEQVSNLFVTGALIVIYQLIRSGKYSALQCILAGVFTCLAMNVRQTGIFAALVVAAAILSARIPPRKKLTGFGWAAIGGLVGFVIVLAWVMIISDIASYLRVFFIYPRIYAGLGTWQDSWALVKWIFDQPMGILGGGFLLLALFRNWPVALACAAATVISVAIPHRQEFHYWSGGLPYLALLAGIGLEKFAGRLQTISLSAALLIFPVCSFDLIGMYKTADASTRWQQALDTARKIDEFALPHSSVLVWGPIGSDAIVYASQREPVNKHWVLWTMEPPADKLLPVSVNYIQNEYLANPPKFIAEYRPFLEKIKSSKDPNADFGPTINLGKMLLDHYHYTEVGNAGDYVVAVLSDGGNG
jgi:hypothetical protein